MSVLFHLTEHETVALEFTYRMCLEYSTYVPCGVHVLVSSLVIY